MARYVTPSEAARLLGNHPRTIANWLRNRYIRAYVSGARPHLVDLDEIDRALATNKHMRDPRKRYGGSSNVVDVSAPGAATDGSAS